MTYYDLINRINDNKNTIICKKDYTEQHFRNFIGLKTLGRDSRIRLRIQYKSKWSAHIKTNCGFNCKKRRWPSW